MSSAADSLTLRAADRALTLADPNADPAALVEALAWIDQSPDNEAAMERVERFLSACDAIRDRDPGRITASPLPDAAPTFYPFVRRLAELAVAASLTLAIFGLTLFGVGLDPAHWRDRPDRQHYASAVGEIRKVGLPDGSRVILAGASAISISFDREIRRVALTEGEAFFEVSHDAARPFIVETGSGSTRAIGTAFDIHRDPRGATVTVVEGVVEVRAPNSNDRRVNRARLPANMQVSYRNDGVMEAPRRVDPRTVTSWRTGRFNFSNQPLATVVAELNRYSLKPIAIEGYQIGLIPITGVVEADGIAEWLQGVASVTGIDVVQTSGSILLRAGKQNDVQSPANGASGDIHHISEI